MCGKKEMGNSHLLFYCRNYQTVIYRKAWMNSMQQTIIKAKLPPLLSEAMTEIFSTLDDGTLMEWKIDPTDVIEWESIESEKDVLEMDRSWALTAEGIANELRKGTGADLVYRGWFAARWINTMVASGIESDVATKFLSSLETKLFKAWLPIWKIHGQTLHAIEDTVEPSHGEKKHVLSDMTMARRAQLDDKHKIANEEIRNARSIDISEVTQLDDDWRRWTITKKNRWLKNTRAILQIEKEGNDSQPSILDYYKKTTKKE